MAVRTHHRRVQDQPQGDEKPQRQRKVKLAKKILTMVVIYFILYFVIFFVTFYHQILGVTYKHTTTTAVQRRWLLYTPAQIPLYVAGKRERLFKELKISQRKLFPKTHFVS